MSLKLTLEVSVYLCLLRENNEKIESHTPLILGNERRDIKLQEKLRLICTHTQLHHVCRDI